MGLTKLCSQKTKHRETTCFVFWRGFFVFFQLPEEVSAHTKCVILISNNEPSIYDMDIYHDCSILALAMCTWRETSSSPTAQQLVLRTLLTCERCATTFVSPLENTSSFPPPSSQTRTETSICGSSLRKPLISSKFQAQRTSLLLLLLL